MLDFGIFGWLIGMEKWNCYFDVGKKVEEAYIYNYYTLRLVNFVNFKIFNCKRLLVMKG